MTLKKIALTGSMGTVDQPSVAWQGPQELFIDGTGNVDASGITLSVPAGTITGIQLTFASQAKVKGSILGKTFYADHVGNPLPTAQVDVYTKASLAWNAYASANGGTGGGATSYNAFTAGPAEEMDISIDTAQTEFTVTTGSNAVIAAGDSPMLTILFDLSRVLRFYAGTRNAGGTDGTARPSPPPAQPSLPSSIRRIET